MVVNQCRHRCILVTRDTVTAIQCPSVLCRIRDIRTIFLEQGITGTVCYIRNIVTQFGFVENRSIIQSRQVKHFITNRISKLCIEVNRTPTVTTDIKGQSETSLYNRLRIAQYNAVLVIDHTITVLVNQFHHTRAGVTKNRIDRFAVRCIPTVTVRIVRNEIFRSIIAIRLVSPDITYFVARTEFELIVNVIIV